MNTHFGVEDFFLTGNGHNVCRENLQIGLYTAKLCIFLLQFYSVFVKLGNVGCDILCIAITAFICKGALFQMPRSAIRQNEHKPILFRIGRGDEIISKTMFKVGDILHVFSTHGKAEALHCVVTKHGKSRFIKEAYAGWQVV